LLNAYQAYEVLNLKSSASFDEIKDAYRKLALELHPDKNKTQDEGTKFKKITEAYHILKLDMKHGAYRLHKNPEGKSYTDKQTSRKQNFEKAKPWGTPPGNKPPEQDWSKFTNEFEAENPNFWKEYEKKFWEEYNHTINADGRNGEYNKTKEPKEQPNLFVDVDPSLCIACQSCETIAPEVFRVDKKTQMNPKSKVINMRGAGINKIMSAAETCPTKAIRVDNKDTNEKLYPF